MKSGFILMKHVSIFLALLISNKLFAQIELDSKIQIGESLSTYGIVNSYDCIEKKVFDQEIIDNKSKNNLFIKGTVGFMEYVSFSTGYFIFNDLSVGIMINLTGKKSEMNLPEPNVGIEISKSFNNWDFFINNITITAVKGILKTNNLDFHLQTTVGKSGNISNGFNLIWGVGILYINNSDSEILPILKLGTQVNL